MKNLLTWKTVRHIEKIQKNTIRFWIISTQISPVLTSLQQPNAILTQTNKSKPEPATGCLFFFYLDILTMNWLSIGRYSESLIISRLFLWLDWTPLLIIQKINRENNNTGLTLLVQRSVQLYWFSTLCPAHSRSSNALSYSLFANHRSINSAYKLDDSWNAWQNQVGGGKCWWNWFIAGKSFDREIFGLKSGLKCGLKYGLKFGLKCRLKYGLKLWLKFPKKPKMADFWNFPRKSFKFPEFLKNPQQSSFWARPFHCCLAVFGGLLGCSRPTTRFSL